MSTAQSIEQWSSFQKRLQSSLQQDPTDSYSFKVKKNASVYNEQKEAAIYFVESGQIKLLMHSPEGKQCIVSVYTAGDIFGDLYLYDKTENLKTAIAMQESSLKKMPSDKFFMRLSRDSLLTSFVEYLSLQIKAQQQDIADLITTDSNQRLGKVLLKLADKIGKRESNCICIPQKFSHEELSEMVGTTRPRISKFMKKFRDLGLINFTKQRYIVINEMALRIYLEKNHLTTTISTNQNTFYNAF